MNQSDSELVEKGLPCPDCGSSDALALYSDGHTYCFSCGTYTPAAKDGNLVAKAQPKDTRPFSLQLSELLEGAQLNALPKWKITQATARALGYYTKMVTPEKGYHIAVYKDEAGQPVFAKVRIVTPDNTKAGFFSIGDESRVSVWGIETVGKGGKMIVVTEGEKDRLAGSQLWGNKFPVVGIPFGAESSAEAFARALPRLTKYDKVVLALDMDGQGRAGAQVLARMLPPGKAYIPEFPRKDLHETFDMDGPEVAINALHNANPYRPDGIVNASDLWGQALSPIVWGSTLPFQFMTDWTYGIRPGDVVVIGAGTGVGKSDLEAEMVAHCIKPKQDGGNFERVSMFNYEAGPVTTLKAIAGKLRNRRFHIPDDKGLLWEPQDLIDARTYMETQCATLFINDHYGSVDWESVKDRVRYLRHAERIEWAFVDPVAALVAQETDDRKALDKLFAESKSLAEELALRLVFVSHLTRPAFGPSHEEGGRVALNHFRGSGAIAMWASFVWGMERNQQSEDEEERAVATIRSLKDRFTGDSTGKTAPLVYNRLSGRYEVPVSKLDQYVAQDEEEDIAPPPVA